MVSAYQNEGLWNMSKVVGLINSAFNLGRSEHTKGRYLAAVILIIHLFQFQFRKK